MPSTSSRSTPSGTIVIGGNGFDCTKPVGDPNFAPRLGVPADVLAAVELADWIPNELRARIPLEPWG